MPIGYKSRKWQAVLTVSSSGPEFSPVLDHGGRFLKPRMAADLSYTTADVDFLESYFRQGITTLARRRSTAVCEIRYGGRCFRRWTRLGSGWPASEMTLTGTAGGFCFATLVMGNRVTGHWFVPTG